MTRMSINSHGCLLLLFLHCISILYISNMIIYNSHEIHFGTTVNYLL
jgi:hypothetical protein